MFFSKERIQSTERMKQIETLAYMFIYLDGFTMKKEKIWVKHVTKIVGEIYQ